MVFSENTHTEFVCTQVQVKKSIFLMFLHFLFIASVLVNNEVVCSFSHPYRLPPEALILKMDFTASTWMVYPAVQKGCLSLTFHLTIKPFDKYRLIIACRAEWSFFLLIFPE